MFGQDDNNNPGDEQHGDQSAEEVVKPADTPGDDNWQHPGPPPADDDGLGGSGNEPDNDDSDDNSDDNPPAGPPDNHGDSADDDGADSGNDLIDLKQEALGKLSPLVGHLNQSPGEKFRTLLMMIQASDDQNLVREAYETALKIDDEKERAQALLDIVNEINYFTQNGNNAAD